LTVLEPLIAAALDFVVADDFSKCSAMVDFLIVPEKAASPILL